MPAVVQCSCGGKFQAPDNLLGKVVPCPNCKTPIQIPAAQPAPLDNDPLGPPTGAANDPLGPPAGAAYDPLAMPQQAGGYQNAGYQNAGYQNPGYQAGGYQNPGYPSMGYGQPPAQPAATGKKLPMGLIIGGGAGAAVLLVGLVVVGLFVFSGSEEKPLAQSPPATNNPPGTGKPAAGTPTPPTGDPGKQPAPAKPVAPAETPAKVPAKKPAPAASLAENLRGSWRIKSMMGRALDESGIIAMLELKDGRISMDASGLPGSIAYTVNDTKQPAQFDLKLPGGKTVGGLVEVSGDTLRLALPPRGSSKRPGSFDDTNSMQVTAERHVPEKLTKEAVATLLEKSAWRVTMFDGRPESDKDEMVEFYKGQVWSLIVAEEALDCSIDVSKSPPHINLNIPGRGKVQGLIDFKGDIMRLSLPSEESRKRPSRMSGHDGIYLTAVRYIPPPVVTLRPESGQPPAVAMCNETTRFSTRFSNLPFDKALERLEKDSGMRLNYRAENPGGTVSLNISDGTIWDATRQLSTDDVEVRAVQGGVIRFEPFDEFEGDRAAGEPLTKGVFHIKPRDDGWYRILTEPKFTGEMTAYQIEFTDKDGKPQLAQQKVEMTDRVSADRHGRYFQVAGVSGDEVGEGPHQLYALFDVVTAVQPQTFTLDQLKPQFKPVSGGTMAITSTKKNEDKYDITFMLRGKLAAGFDFDRNPGSIEYVLVTPGGERIPAVGYGFSETPEYVKLDAAFPLKSLGETPLRECKLSMKSSTQAEVVTEPLKNYMTHFPHTSLCEIQDFSAEATDYYANLKSNPAIKVRFKGNGARIPYQDIRLEVGGKKLAPVKSDSDYLQPVEYDLVFQLPREMKDLSKIKINFPVPSKVEQHALDIELPPIKQ